MEGSMTKLIAAGLLSVLAVAVYAAVAVPEQASVAPAPNGIPMPEGYKDWRMLASSCRSDNNTMRVILGNDVAVEAARAEETNPWPDGAVLAKLVWKQVAHPKWETAAVPGDFVHVEFMIKDSERYPATGGWGFARWLGLDQKPFGEDERFVQTCFGCHLPVADNDYVFTKPAVLP
jgi:hypothetical protein